MANSFSGMVRIVDSAAQADIAKIRNAQENLNNSLASIQKLKANAAGMQGLTGTAIVEQSQKMESRINEMNSKLNATIVTIQKIVNWYHEEDRRLASKISSI